MSDFRLYHGDCAEVMKGIPESSVSAIVSDPPYGCGFANDFYDDSHGAVFAAVPGWFQEWRRVLKPDSYLFLFVGVMTLHEWIRAGIDAGFDYRNVLATRSFNRGLCAPKGNFVYEFQPVIVFSKGKRRKFNQVDFFRQSKEWFHDKRNKNPREFTYAYSNWIPSELAYGTETFGQTKEGDAIHPNAKNVKLLQFLIGISTDPGETVLDPFNGSGSTGVAALNIGRDYIGIEQDKTWYENSMRRLNDTMPLFRSAV